jgi:hypothetical protein
MGAITGARGEQMRGIEQRVSAVVLAAALSMGFSRSAAAQMAREPTIQRESQAVYQARIPVPPPAVKTEVTPADRALGAVWIPGFWDLQGDPRTAPHAGWVWVPGRLEQPPMPGAHWDEAHWGWNAEWWSWIPGHWDEPGPSK